LEKIVKISLDKYLTRESRDFLGAHYSLLNRHAAADVVGFHVFAGYCLKKWGTLNTEAELTYGHRLFTAELLYSFEEPGGNGSGIFHKAFAAVAGLNDSEEERRAVNFFSGLLFCDGPEDSAKANRWGNRVFGMRLFPEKRTMEDMERYDFYLKISTNKLGESVDGSATEPTPVY